MCDVLCIYSIVHKYDKPLSRVFIDFYASFQTPRQACTWSSDVIVQLDELIMINKQYRVTNLQSLFFFLSFNISVKHVVMLAPGPLTYSCSMTHYFVILYLFLCFYVLFILLCFIILFLSVFCGIALKASSSVRRHSYIRSNDVSM